MRGLDLHLAYQSTQNVSALHEARRLLEQSIRIDPAYARPYSALAISHLSSWANYGDVDFLQSAALERAQEFARHAVQLDPQLAYAEATFAHVLTWARQHEVVGRRPDRRAYQEVTVARDPAVELGIDGRVRPGGGQDPEREVVPRLVAAGVRPIRGSSAARRLTAR